MTWNDERVSVLKRLWKDGLSASQIANELGGVTRNAVIGKVTRLGLTGRASTRPMKPKRAAMPSAPRQRLAATFRTVLAITLPPAAPEPPPQVILAAHRCTLLALREDTCRWPIGDPMTPEFFFCGGKSVDGLPYCCHHARMAYQPVADRRRDGQPVRG